MTGEYDAPRHAFSARIEGRSSSPARMLAAQADDSAALQPAVSASGDSTRTRCLLTAVLKGGDNFDLAQTARITHAAQKCKVAEQDVAAWAHTQRAGFFTGERVNSLTISYLMATSMTVVTIVGPPAKTPEIEQLLSSI